MAEWFDDENFWKRLYPFLFAPEQFEKAEEEVEKILNLTSFRGDSVLDLCCGPGRHAVLLAKRGLSVTGVDKSPFLLKKARERARKENVRVRWRQQDMRHFCRPESFGLILSLFTSFGYFDAPEDDQKALSNVFQSLKPGGTFIVDVVGKEILAKIYQPIHSKVLSDGSLLVERHEIVEDWSRIKNEWIIIKGETVHRFKFQLRVYSGQELKARLAEAGFSEIHLYGNFDGHPYGPEADRLIAVAKKAVI